MKIAIISDTHDNLTNLEKAISLIKKEKIEVIIHCGDISTPNTLKEILKNFSGRVYLVFGNVDQDLLSMTKLCKEFNNLKIFDKVGELEIEGKKIAFLHSPQLARDLANEQKYNIIFYGHTHKPWEEKIGKTKLVNPGNIAGLYYKASFAIYDPKEDKLELKLLEKLK